MLEVSPVTHFGQWKLVDLTQVKLEKALACFCFVSCSFAFALRTRLGHGANPSYPLFQERSSEIMQRTVDPQTRE